MKKTTYVLVIVGLLASNTILPKDEGHGFPVYTITYQFINLSIVVLLLTFLLKTKISNFYKEKHENFHEFLNKAEKTKQELEAHHQELTEKIENLEATKNETIRQAHSEADELKRRTLAEASNLSSKLEHDVKMTTQLEIEKQRKRFENICSRHR